MPATVRLSPNRENKIFIETKPSPYNKEFKELKMTDLGVYIDQPLNLKNLERMHNFNLQCDHPYMITYSNTAFVPVVNSNTIK